MLAVTQINWYSLLSTLFVGAGTTTVLWQFIQRNAKNVEERRKQYARKLARKQDAHTRTIVHEVLAEHMGIEERTIEAVLERIATLEAGQNELLSLYRTLDGLKAIAVSVPVLTGKEPPL